MELPGRWKRGRPQRRFMGVVNDDMEVVGVREEGVRERLRWRQMTGNGKIRWHFQLPFPTTEPLKQSCFLFLSSNKFQMPIICRHRHKKVKWQQKNLLFVLEKMIVCKNIVTFSSRSAYQTVGAARCHNESLILFIITVRAAQAVWARIWSSSRRHRHAGPFEGSAARKYRCANYINTIFWPLRWACVHRPALQQWWRMAAELPSQKLFLVCGWHQPS